MELSDIFPKKIFLIFQEGTFKTRKTKKNPLCRNFLYFSKKVFYSHSEMTAVK